MKQRKIPLRKCTGCLEMKGKKELIRIVRTEPDGFLLDYTGKKSGRGAYICPSRQCLSLARKKKGLERSFRQEIPPEVYEKLDRDIKLNEP